MNVVPINLQTNINPLKCSSSSSAVYFTSERGKFLNKPDIFVRSREENRLPWIKDDNLLKSINNLEHIKFEKNDVKYIQSLGIVLPFKSGEEAVAFIEKSHIGVKFEDLHSVNTHAQYDFEDNCIKINKIYKNTQNPAEILAISEAILHESGHAKDLDSESSLQEEIDCLAMNALSHRVFIKKSPKIFDNDNSLIVKDGVCIYSELFFDDNPLKLGLVERLREKYGDLPAGDLEHPPSAIAMRVKGF